MPKPRVAVAAGNVAGGRAATGVARAGGNAVDACLASAITAWAAEPFFASLGGSGFVAVRDPDGSVEIFDGNNAMPRRAPQRPDQGLRRVYLDYSNGMWTGIGGGSVAVPGVLAAARLAWERYGSIEWAALFDGALTVARRGLDFPRTSAYYLSVTWEPIWSVHPESRALFGVTEPIGEGDRLFQPELADALDAVARDGPGTFYGGPLGEEIARAVAADEGLVALDDLEHYRAELRAPVSTNAFGWRIESNPPPAMGGTLLTHMLAILADADLDDPVARLQAIVAAEQAVLARRAEHDEDPGDVAGAVGDGRRARSASTTHTSAADADGLVCSITESNGYGSGLVVHGILLNNTLGEEELNPLGPHRLPSGARCHSNMAPTVASGPGTAVGIGSPGADRIVGAIAQTIVALAVDGCSLEDAVAMPRAHLAARPEGPLLCFEPGLPGHELGYELRPYDAPHMFFGAVQAASVDDSGAVDAAHDPRRSGASAIV